MKHLHRILRITIWSIVDILVMLMLAIVLYTVYVESTLPDVSILKDIKMQVPMKVYTSDGKLIAEFSEKRRIPVSYDQVPPMLINAILATEDQRFFEHEGVDPMGLMRATVKLIATGTKSQGGSTITMQVARNFFLNRRKTYSRKFKEILLAIKIDKSLSKKRILELYLNQIYLGNHAYGVAAAAQVYYGKTLDQLTLAEIAMIAGLPKAPSALNPIDNPVAAKKRRAHVLERMESQKYITPAQYKAALSTPVGTYYHSLPIDLDAPYIAEMVRNTMVNQFGEENAYNSGFSVYTTVNSVTQHQADQALLNGLLAYDERHGYRGPIGHFSGDLNLATWQKDLKKYPRVNDLQPAAIIKVNQQSAIALLQNGHKITIPWQGLSWARKKISDKYLGKKPQTAQEVVQVGDIVYTQFIQNNWHLSQKPTIEGALVAMSPNDGAVLALVGGFSFDKSKYNRAVQAKRQPGSSFKPFIFSAALAKGYTLATIINDAPVVITMPNGTVWRPQNNSKRFYGPTRLRVGLIESRNLVSIRLLQLIGISYAVQYISNFGFDPHKLPHAPSLALGTADLSPLEMVTAYSVFANGGYRVKPYFIDHILDSDGNLVYQAKPLTACEKCITQVTPGLWSNPDSAKGNYPPQTAPVAINPQIAYIMTSAMKDVIHYGTARRAKVLDRTDVAGKTGTTNDFKDAWFAGFNSDIATVVWVGYDQPRSIYEYGSQAALPIWIDFMEQALEGKPEHTMPEPPGLVVVRIDPETGKIAPPWQKNATFEIFRKSILSTQQTENNWVNPDEITRDEGYIYDNSPETTNQSLSNDNDTSPAELLF